MLLNIGLLFNVHPYTLTDQSLHLLSKLHSLQLQSPPSLCSKPSFVTSCTSCRLKSSINSSQNQLLLYLQCRVEELGTLIRYFPSSSPPTSLTPFLSSCHWTGPYMTKHFTAQQLTDAHQTLSVTTPTGHGIVHLGLTAAQSQTISLAASDIRTSAKRLLRFLRRQLKAKPAYDTDRLDTAYRRFVLFFILQFELTKSGSTTVLVPTPDIELVWVRIEFTSSKAKKKKKLMPWSRLQLCFDPMPTESKWRNSQSQPIPAFIYSTSVIVEDLLWRKQQSYGRRRTKWTTKATQSLE